MSNFSKIVIIILILLTFFFVKEKYGQNIDNFISSIGTVKNIDLNKNDEEKPEVVKEPTEIPTENNKNENVMIPIYFLSLDADDNGVYKVVKRELKDDDNRLAFAINELLKGPNIVEKSMGAYSEIPKETKLLSIKQSGNKVIIDFSEDFQYGGGTDSIYSRMMQLIKTAINNTDKKKIYLYLEGKQLNFIGGEGIMVSQPLTEKSLDM